MREIVKCGKEFNIISRIVDNATKCTVVEVFDDSFTVKLDLKSKYEQGETVDLFTMTQKGQMYSESVVKEVISDDMITIWFPLVFRYLQRREYSRVRVDKDVVIESENGIIRTLARDISAGGLKVKSPVQLSLSKIYKTKIDFDNLNMTLDFEPVRAEVSEDGFEISGRFKNLNNRETIALVQYCFMKQAEQVNL